MYWQRENGHKKKISSEAEEARAWFFKHVTENGKAYTLDLEQAVAVADRHKNTIVAARAGSGKTRTLVAKIIYLIAHEKVRSDEIVAFVFNHSAMGEINQRLRMIKVDGESVVPRNKQIAYTFHSFAVRIVNQEFQEKNRIRGTILTENKTDFVAPIVKEMMAGKEMPEADLKSLTKQLVNFINRAQQKYLTSSAKIGDDIKKRLADPEADKSEKRFLRRGLECYKRYHKFLLDQKEREKLGPLWAAYGVDFNLIISWGTSFILKGVADELIKKKRYILIDEYQDFSQLFLSMITAMRKVTPEAKMFVVGDDWQAINRFAGSDVDYFKNFERYFPEDTKRLGITTNYRCDYTIIDTARKFMKGAMKETGKFRAASKKAGEVMTVTVRAKKEDYLERVADLIHENWKAKKIMVLHRNNETHLKMDLENFRIETGKCLWRKYRIPRNDFNKKVSFFTIHRAKGLEAEVVILAEADAGVIPREHPDTHLYNIFGETKKAEFEDQVRLFYVALTRAKKKLYIMYDGNSKDSFIHFLGKGVEEWEEK